MFWNYIFCGIARLSLINLIINILNEWNRGTIDTGYPKPININRPLSKQFNLGMESNNYSTVEKTQRPLNSICITIVKRL